jgi:hypothetical protein
LPNLFRFSSISGINCLRRVQKRVRGEGMYEWIVVIGVGLIGGVFDAILTGGFVRPQKITAANQTVWDPGFLGNIAIGGAAGFASWALTVGASFGDSTIDVGPIIAAFLAGAGGGEVLRGFVQRQYLEGTTDQMATALSQAAAREQALREEIERLKNP